MVYVIKRSGEREEFDPDKVTSALIRAGAPRGLAEEITKKVAGQAQDGISTGKIFGIAYGLLERENASVAARYSLKQAIMVMGPTGFPFEQYMARVLAENGYATETNLLLKGRCVQEEVDIAAKMGKVSYMTECKYHNELGIITGLKEALYTWARFEDVTAGGYEFTAPWLITNTKISDQALTYAACKGMKTTSWGHPRDESLQALIEGKRLYPVTIIVGLTGEAKRRLFEANITLVEDIKKMPQAAVAKVTGLSLEDIKPLMQQIAELAEKGE